MQVDDKFIDRILDGEANEQEVEGFQVWLDDPRNMQRYVLRAELHAQLRKSLKRRSLQEAAIESHDLSHVGDPSARVEIAKNRSDSSAKTSGAFATGRVQRVALCIAALAACLLFVFLRSEAFVEPEQVDVVTAEVVGRVDALLKREDTAWSGEVLSAGSYHLQRGLLNLRFGGGVMVYVEAPASFEAVSDQRVVLRSGRLSANVPPEGIGFTVETPEAEVVDFGTEFSVDVAAGTSEVHVFEGLVRVHPDSQDGTRKDAVDLKASQAIRITDSEPEPLGIQIAKDRFIRNFEEPKRKYVRALKLLSPLVIYRMPIRDLGLVSEPPQHSGVVLKGEGVRPPHAKGAFGGSLRVGADSSGRGGRVDDPPELTSGHFSMVAFVYRETNAASGTIATNVQGQAGVFEIAMDASRLQVEVACRDGRSVSAIGKEKLPLKEWRHIVVTADGEHLKIFEDGMQVASTLCGEVFTTNAVPIWFGTDSGGVRIWNGRIDELALFNRALSGEEIAELFEIAQEDRDGK